MLKIYSTLSFGYDCGVISHVMGMDFLVSKYEKESLSSIMWFEAPESIKSALDFEVLAIRA